MNQEIAKTYLTVRMKDGTSKNGKVFQRVVNLFQGGNDSRGMPIFNNAEERFTGFVGASSGNLNLYATDKKTGQVITGEDGKISKAVLSINLSKFVDGHAQGLASKGLTVGSGTITGPGAAAVAKKLAGVIEAAKAAKATKVAA